MHGYKVSKNLDIGFVEESVNQLYNINLDLEVLMELRSGHTLHLTCISTLPKRVKY